MICQLEIRFYIIVEKRIRKRKWHQVVSCELGENRKELARLGARRIFAKVFHDLSVRALHLLEVLLQLLYCFLRALVEFLLAHPRELQWLLHSTETNKQQQGAYNQVSVLRLPHRLLPEERGT